MVTVVVFILLLLKGDMDQVQNNVFVLEFNKQRNGMAVIHDDFRGNCRSLLFFLRPSHTLFNKACGVSQSLTRFRITVKDMQ